MHFYVLYVTEQRNIGRLFIESRYSYPQDIRNHYTIQWCLYSGKSLPRQNTVLVCLKQSKTAWSFYFLLSDSATDFFLYYFVCVVLNCLSLNVLFSSYLFIFIFILFDVVRVTNTGLSHPPCMEFIHFHSSSAPFNVLIKCLFQYIN